MLLEELDNGKRTGHGVNLNDLLQTRDEDVLDGTTVRRPVRLDEHRCRLANAGHGDLVNAMCQLLKKVGHNAIHVMHLEDEEEGRLRLKKAHGCGCCCCCCCG